MAPAVGSRPADDVRLRSIVDSARPDPAALAGLLREMRTAAGLTQRALAQRARVSERTLRELERGAVRTPRTASVRRLADALEATGPPRQRLLAAAAALPAPDPQPWIGVLGRLLLRVAGAPAEPGQPMLRELLGLFALQPGRALTREEIIDALWGDEPPATARSLVHGYVRQLRAVLEPHRQPRGPARTLLRTGPGYRLVVPVDALDLTRFDRLAAAARRAEAAGDLDGAYDAYLAALDCWRGPLLGGEHPRLCQRPEAVAVTDRRLAAALGFADVAIRLGRPEPAAARLRVLAAAEPLHEGLHARLMLTLAGAGDTATALRLYAEVRARLDEELGVEPGTELRAAQVRVLRRQVPVPELVPPDPAGPVPAQLPAGVATFTGRAELLDRLDGLLDTASTGPAGAVCIVVLTGMAGLGKTALAVHWAHRIRSRFPDGQLYVDLRGHDRAAPLSPIDALSRFLRGLGVPAGQVPVDPDEAAAAYRSVLSGRRTLTLLDNACSAEQVRPLLPGTAGSLVLITSRQALPGLVARDGAIEIGLDVLTDDEAQGLLVRLLGPVRAAREPAALADLARLCGNLPLALRIAGANLTGRPDGAVGGYIADLRSGDRLSALTVGDDPQSAVRAAFDLSYGALEPPARRLFRLLGLVPGADVSLDGAAALAGVPLAEVRPLLARLAAAHLVDEHVPGRFRCHDLLHLYAAELAAAHDGDRCAPARQRLHGYYLGHAAAAAELLYPQILRLPIAAEDWPVAAPAPAFDSPAAAIGWLDAERPNLAATVTDAAEHGPAAVAWLLADLLRGYFFMGKYSADWLAIAGGGLAAARTAGDARGQAAAHLSLAGLYGFHGRHADAIEHYRHALELSARAGWRRCEAAVRSNLGAVYADLGRMPESVAQLELALDLNRDGDWLGGEPVNLANLGVVHREQGSLERAVEPLTRALDLHRRAGSRSGEGETLSALGEVLHLLGDTTQARERLTAALAIHRSVGNRGNEADTLRVLAALHRDMAQLDRARDLAVEALELAGRTGHLRLEADALNTLGSVERAVGEPATAMQRHTRALAVARRCGSRYPQARALDGLAAAHHALGEPDAALRYATQALELARQAPYRLIGRSALVRLAEIRLAAGAPAQALALADEAAALARSTGHRLGLAHAELTGARALERLGPAGPADERRRAGLDLLAELGVPTAAVSCW